MMEVNVLPGSWKMDSNPQLHTFHQRKRSGNVYNPWVIKWTRGQGNGTLVLNYEDIHRYCSFWLIVNEWIRSFTFTSHWFTWWKLMFFLVHGWFTQNFTCSMLLGQNNGTMPLVQKEIQYLSSRFEGFTSIPAAWGNDFDLINDSYEHHHSEIIKALAT